MSNKLEIRNLKRRVTVLEAARADYDTKADDDSETEAAREEVDDLAEPGYWSDSRLLDWHASDSQWAALSLREKRRWYALADAIKDDERLEKLEAAERHIAESVKRDMLAAGWDEVKADDDNPVLHAFDVCKANDDERETEATKEVDDLAKPTWWKTGASWSGLALGRDWDALFRNEQEKYLALADTVIEDARLKRTISIDDYNAGIDLTVWRDQIARDARKVALKEAANEVKRIDAPEDSSPNWMQGFCEGVTKAGQAIRQLAEKDDG